MCGIKRILVFNDAFVNQWCVGGCNGLSRKRVAGAQCMSLGPLVAFFAACSLFRSDKDRFLLSNHPAFYPPCIQGHTPFLLSFAFAYFDQWTRFLTKRLVNCITGECNWKRKESLFSPRYGTQKTCSSSSADSVCCSKMDWGRGDGSQYFQAAPRKEKKRRYVKLTAMGYLVLYPPPPPPAQGKGRCSTSHVV